MRCSLSKLISQSFTVFLTCNSLHAAVVNLSKLYLLMSLDVVRVSLRFYTGHVFLSSATLIAH